MSNSLQKLVDRVLAFYPDYKVVHITPYTGNGYSFFFKKEFAPDMASAHQVTLNALMYKSEFAIAHKELVFVKERWQLPEATEIAKKLYGN